MRAGQNSPASRCRGQRGRRDCHPPRSCRTGRTASRRRGSRRRGLPSTARRRRAAQRDAVGTYRNAARGQGSRRRITAHPGAAIAAAGARRLRRGLGAACPSPGGPREARRSSCRRASCMLREQSMCGIAGLYAPEQVAPEARLAAVEAMCRRMAARGPDAHALLAPAAGLVLGHRRLSIIDLDARSNQPMWSADGRLVIVYNGEIYNYRELRRELLAAGEVLRTDGDTEVLLALYARHGRQMLTRLRGMFALAIWDARESCLWLARDPHGLKPLYYAAGAHGFVFASQVKALLASGLLATEPSGPGLAGFYLWGSVPEPWTTHAAIQALPAGHWLEV